MCSFLLCGVCQSLDVRKTAPRIGRSFCVCTPMRNFWSFCGYAQISPLRSLCGRTQNRSPKFLCMYANKKTSGVSVDMRRLLLCGVSATVRKKLRATIRYLRICANQSFLEFLRICTATEARKSDISSQDTQIIQYWSFCFRTQKSSAPLLAICVSTQMNTFWSFCGCVQLLEREKYTIRKSSSTGVSATVLVRKKAPCH